MRIQDRLTPRQIAVLRMLLKFGASAVPVSLHAKLRRIVITLWRRELVQIWYRQSIHASLQGPFVSLTIAGARLASAFVLPQEGRAR